MSRADAARRRAATIGGVWCTLAAAGACGDGPGPAPRPVDVRLRLVGGDGQEGRVAGAALPVPLVVGVDAASGGAADGVAVTWSSADGTLDGAARTDGRGEARAVWRLAPRVGPQVAVARTASGDSVVFRARLVASAARLARDTLVLRASERGRLAWQVVDAAGRPLDADGVRWASADPTVATVNERGEVEALADGVTAVTLDGTALGLQPPGPRAIVVVGTPIAGVVQTADGEAPRGLRVHVRTPAGTDSADVAPDGTFALVARSAALRAETEVVVDAADRAARAWFPALARYPASADGAPAPLRFVLVPRRWRMRDGTFRGQEVALSLDAALGGGVPHPAPGTPWYDRSWFFKQVGPLGTAPSLEAFPDDAFPLPVYLDRERSSWPITADDSVALWRSLDAMSDAVGARLFRPAEKRDLPARELATTTGALTVRPFSVAVVVDSTLVDGLAASTWTTACLAVGAPADPCAGVLDRIDGTLYFGGFRRRIRERDLVQHEAGHVLGLGHTCRWWSVMFGSVDPTWTDVFAGCRQRFQDGAWPEGRITRTTEITLRDAAYLAAYLRTAAAVRRLGAAHSLYAGFLGERRLLLGLN